MTACKLLSQMTDAELEAEAVYLESTKARADYASHGQILGLLAWEAESAGMQSRLDSKRLVLEEIARRRGKG